MKNFVVLFTIFYLFAASCWANSLEARFHEIYDEAVFAVYKKNLDFTHNFITSDTQVRGVTDSEVVINFRAGEVPRRMLNKEVKAVVYCHEIGHLLGEGRRDTLHKFRLLGMGKFSSIKIANEGEADFFMGPCLRRFYSYDSNRDHEKVIKKQSHKLSIEELQFIDESCASDENVVICKRSLMAVKNLMQIISYKDKVEIPLLFDKSPEQARGIYTFHPDALCRNETLVNSILQAHRPACWYNP